MSVLARAKPQSVIQDATQNITVVRPSSNNIVVAGTTDPTHVAPDSPTTSSVRAHLLPGTVNTVHAFTEIVPKPLPLGEKHSIAQIEAARELSDYASDLCAPIECSLTDNDTYESDTSFSRNISVETLVQNMRQYDLCLKTTISSESPHFTPSVYRIDAQDLQRLNAREGIEEGGMLSKFIHAKCESVPHHILFHITQDDITSPHRFYGIAYVQKDSFSDLNF